MRRNDGEFKEIHYPVYFERKNICVSCGAEGTLIFVNIFGKNSSNHEVYPLEYIKCSRCKAEYSIKWTKSEDGKIYPSAVDKNLYTDFVNLFNFICKGKDDQIYKNIS